VLNTPLISATPFWLAFSSIFGLVRKYTRHHCVRPQTKYAAKTPDIVQTNSTRKSGGYPYESPNFHAKQARRKLNKFEQETSETLAIRLNTLFTNGLGIYLQLHVSMICNSVGIGRAVQGGNRCPDNCI
jgi:hypothetical protein